MLNCFSMNWMNCSSQNLLVRDVMRLMICDLMICSGTCDSGLLSSALMCSFELGSLAVSELPFEDCT
jgi:hypothetical protein